MGLKKDLEKVRGRDSSSVRFLDTVCLCSSGIGHGIELSLWLR